jgi:hypothetical protein
MFKRQTLFVLGAGSSAEVGLPVGTQLAETIGKKVDIRYDGTKHTGQGDLDLYDNLTRGGAFTGQHALEFQSAGWRIRDGIRLAQSIDDFLDLHRSDKFMTTYGKAAIVKAILEAERNSKLFYNRFGGAERNAFDPALIADTWFVKFMHRLGRGIPKESASTLLNRVSFINFNYDRCLEYFLTHAIRALYNLRYDELPAILASLRLVHPYGAIGGDVEFGGRVDYSAEAQRIKTYTEQIEDASIVEQIREEVVRAECIVFLGFAYHSQNLSILNPRRKMDYKPVYGTAYKMSKADVEVVVNQIANFFDIPGSYAATGMVKLESLKSADLFDYYAKSLSGGD